MQDRAKRNLLRYAQPLAWRVYMAYKISHPLPNPTSLMTSK